MKIIEWDKKKNNKLIKERSISFEMVECCIREKSILAIEAHPNQKKYSHQKIIVIAIADYAYIVPFVEDEEKIFLKTIIPSRRATREYLK